MADESIWVRTTGINEPAAHWVKRAEPPEHECDPPGRPVRVLLPDGPAMASTGSRLVDLPGEHRADGRSGDLWRCDCRRLWRVGWACDYCDRYGPWNHVRGPCVAGTKWRPATFWQRVRWWRR